MRFASSGNGSSQHLGAAMFMKASGTEMIHVPYKGSAQALSDLLSGQVDLNFDSPPPTLQFIKAGQLRALAITSDTRLSLLPDVPTMTEQGAVGSSYETRAFAAFAVPSATPKDIVKKLSDTLIEAGTDEKVKQLLANYMIIGPLSFEATNARFKRDTEIMLAVLNF